MYSPPTAAAVIGVRHAQPSTHSVLLQTVQGIGSLLSGSNTRTLLLTRMSSTVLHHGEFFELEQRVEVHGGDGATHCSGQYVPGFAASALAMPCDDRGSGRFDLGHSNLVVQQCQRLVTEREREFPPWWATCGHSFS